MGYIDFYFFGILERQLFKLADSQSFLSLKVESFIWLTFIIYLKRCLAGYLSVSLSVQLPVSDCQSTRFSRILNSLNE